MLEVEASSGGPDISSDSSDVAYKTIMFQIQLILKDHLEQNTTEEGFVVGDQV